MTYLLVDKEGDTVSRDECMRHAYGLLEMATFDTHGDLERGSRAQLAIGWMKFWLTGSAINRLTPEPGWRRWSKRMDPIDVRIAHRVPVGRWWCPSIDRSVEQSRLNDRYGPEMLPLGP